MLHLYAAIAIVGICLFFKWQLTFWSRQHVKGPTPIPIVGNMLQYLLKKKHYGEVYDQIYR